MAAVVGRLGSTSRSRTSGITFPTASFHRDNILTYPAGQIFDVITNGTGLMAGYRWPITPADRWAIVACARELERKRLASAPQRVRPASAAKRLRRGLAVARQKDAREGGRQRLRERP